MGKKLIIVGLPGSGITKLNKYTKYKFIKYFTESLETKPKYLNKYIYSVSSDVVNSIYNNEYFISMYNESYNGSIYIEGISLDKFEDGDILLTTPYEFINIPINIIKDSYIIHIDTNFKFIKDNYQDEVIWYNEFITNKSSSIDQFFKYTKDINIIYFFNEPIERVATICNILLDSNVSEELKQDIIKNFK